jgi:hypothetical protein
MLQQGRESSAVKERIELASKSLDVDIRIFGFIENVKP